MKITRKSLVSGQNHTMDLNITHEQIARYSAGDLIQDAFPQLSAEEREFIMSGITPEEWLATFPPEKDNEL